MLSHTINCYKDMKRNWNTDAEEEWPQRISLSRNGALVTEL